ncbi:hypothetical protein C8R45DRAFT_1046606 [Mycena sanguinolenta]|nr:hypothetical protein C8R45DRAFT_1046606 [Mycena sanguinolenta]
MSLISCSTTGYLATCFWLATLQSLLLPLFPANRGTGKTPQATVCLRHPQSPHRNVMSNPCLYISHHQIVDSRPPHPHLFPNPVLPHPYILPPIADPRRRRSPHFPHMPSPYFCISRRVVDHLPRPRRLRPNRASPHCCILHEVEPHDRSRRMLSCWGRLYLFPAILRANPVTTSWMTVRHQTPRRWPLEALHFNAHLSLKETRPLYAFL